MLVENKLTNKPAVNALLALMCFQASRLDARLDKNGELVLYDEQDTSLWNSDLISRGGYFLNCAASGDEITKYHLEASIAYWHTQKKDTREKWETVLQLYDQLLRLEYSPIAALNRVFVLSKAHGQNEAILEAEKLDIKDNQFHFALLGELYTDIDNNKAKQNFERALALAKTAADKNAIQKKIDKL
jgi:RNA polymerase sigma-70 factor (ECF subfamily)